jgi:hypothetical protein
MSKLSRLAIKRWLVLHFVKSFTLYTQSKEAKGWHTANICNEVMFLKEDLLIPT